MRQPNTLNNNTVVDEGKLVTKVTLQAMVDTADTTSRPLVTRIVLHQDFWLQSSGFPKEVQATLEDLPFDNQKLFSNKVD